MTVGAYDMGNNEFEGKYFSHIDAKGLLTLPVEYTETLTDKDNTIYIANSAFDKCLRVYHGNEWKKIRHKIDNLPIQEEAVKYFLARVIASAQRTKVNRLGGVVLSRALMEDAGIVPDTEVVIIGQRKKFEIWSRKEWEYAQVLKNKF